MTFLTLVAGVIYLHPISIRIGEIDLFYPVYAVGDAVFFAGPVFERHFVEVEGFDEFGDGGHGETEMAVFGMRVDGFGAFDEVEMAEWSDAEPGMSAVVEGLRNGIETDHFLVKFGTDLKVLYIDRNVIQPGFHGIILGFCGQSDHQDREQSDYCFLHSER